MKLKHKSKVAIGPINNTLRKKKMTWEDKSAAVKMTPAVMLLVRMGLASIIPRYQLTKPLLAPRLAAAVVAAAAAVATEELEDESDEEEAGLVPLKRKEMRWNRM
jgi:hypothetical protein